jgi:nitrite reductase/ring-hydroxylating ferredoxin subunit
LEFQKEISLTAVWLLGTSGKKRCSLCAKAESFFAVSASCSHYGGPLAEGLVVENTIRCPWHHACFSLRNGQVLDAPAFDGLDSWLVEQRDGKIYVREKSTPKIQEEHVPLENAPCRIVIIGGAPPALQRRRSSEPSGLIKVS